MAFGGIHGLSDIFVGLVDCDGIIGEINIVAIDRATQYQITQEFVVLRYSRWTIDGGTAASRAACRMHAYAYWSPTTAKFLAHFYINK